MRCGFRRTTIDIGPRGGIKSKTWRCSRTAKHDFQDADCMGKDVGIVCLCTQHLKVAEKSKDKKSEQRKYDENSNGTE